MIKAYFNGKAATWDETAAERDETKLRQMAARLNISPGSAVLDVGTGTGVFIPFLLAKIGRGGRILALDIAEEMLRRAKMKGFDGMVTYLNADVARIPLVDNIFDSVVCYSSFPHFQDKYGALREIYRVMKSGGHLFICHTSSREEINAFHNGIGEVADDVLPDEEEMLTMLSAAGFTDIKIEDNCQDYLCRAGKPAEP